MLNIYQSYYLTQFYCKKICVRKKIKVRFKDESSPSATRKAMYKASETITSFIFEDFAQVGLQYFYFEKYRFRQSIIITFITIFMELKRTGYNKKYQQYHPSETFLDWLDHTMVIYKSSKVWNSSFALVYYGGVREMKVVLMDQYSFWWRLLLFIQPVAWQELYIKFLVRMAS